MKIRTQFIISMAIFGIILLVVSASAIVTNRETERLIEQEETAMNVERGASELSYLAQDYLLYQESQQRARWESRFASFSMDLSDLNPNGPEQQALVNNMKGNQERLKTVFTDFVSAVEGNSLAQDAAAAQAFLQVSWSRMAVQNQEIGFDALRLSQMVRSQKDELQLRSIILIIALFGVFGGYFLTNYITVYRRALRSILKLQAGTTIIGSGNLDFAIPVKRNDEIGDLSRAFNQMAASLKGVTASKKELEKEIAERQKAEEEIRQLNERLSLRATELEVANKELEAFSYTVSHDLRAPLRHIDGVSKVLLHAYADKLDERGKEYLHFLRDGSHKMDQLIDALLKLSRLTRSEIRRENVDLSEMVRLVGAELQQEQPERQVDLVIAPNIRVSGDPRLLQIVLENLLGNAWKFTTKQERPRIEFGTTNARGRPACYVKDNGAGFDAAYADKLFAPFQRLHREEEFPGTGIGLATVQRIILRHGGQVWAEGETNNGAVCYFTLDHEE